MRKVITLLIVFIMISMAALSAPATKIELFIDYAMATVDGKSIAIDADNLRVTPIIREDRTLLPVRFIAENLGMEVYWSEAMRSITLTGDKTIRLTLNDNKAYIDEQLEFLDSPPVVFENRSYLPVRFISEALDRDVEWDELLRKVTISPKAPVVNPMEVYEPIEVLDKLTFIPIFPEGFEDTRFMANGEGFAVEFLGDCYLAYGAAEDENFEFFDQLTKEFFTNIPKDEFPLTSSDAVIVNSIINGKERIAIVNADLGFGDKAADMLQYLAYDEDLKLFIFSAINGTDQESLNRLNELVAGFR